VLTEKPKKNRENTPILRYILKLTFLRKTPPNFKGKQKSRKNRENTPDLKVYFKINIFSKILLCYSNNRGLG
jgi:hypothetical protein